MNLFCNSGHILHMSSETITKFIKKKSSARVPWIRHVYSSDPSALLTLIKSDGNAVKIRNAM